jgi:hypothetical protein
MNHCTTGDRQAQDVPGNDLAQSFSARVTSYPDIFELQALVCRASSNAASLRARHSCASRAYTWSSSCLHSCRISGLPARIAGLRAGQPKDMTSPSTAGSLGEKCVRTRRLHAVAAQGHDVAVDRAWLSGKCARGREA